MSIHVRARNADKIDKQTVKNVFDDFSSRQKKQNRKKNDLYRKRYRLDGVSE